MAVVAILSEVIVEMIFRLLFLTIDLHLLNQILGLNAQCLQICILISGGKFKYLPTGVTRLTKTLIILWES